MARGSARDGNQRQHWSKRLPDANRRVLRSPKGSNALFEPLQQLADAVVSTDSRAYFHSRLLQCSELPGEPRMHSRSVKGKEPSEMVLGVDRHRNACQRRL